MRRGGRQRADRYRRPEIGQVPAHGATASSAFVRTRVAGAPEAGEDLPADRVIPVPEGGPAGGRVGGPEPPAQHPVLVGAEEHLRILRVRVRLEPGVAGEMATGPLPHVTEQLVHA